ncbi:rhomboid family intramembrane serine protease GlpG [Alteromonas ponticola]|uniref:Rhomboid family intramembrane serine protease GlpG n=1 Tax=Alteromonas aquimaris TaxID=2998417 RepID=A0ABT3PB13_9ALTE|nr:rhomboid family intramembrane serine protease GlpG [Alteromonas aquimaris]MCW8109938.1 rhomboid family intramembrane serine protease GlpG [Alteromonas aquimaris]
MSIPVIAFKHEPYARLLANYLTSEGFEVSVHLEPNGEFMLSVPEGTDLKTFRQHCLDFVRDPEHPSYQDIAWQQGAGVELDTKSGFSFRHVKRYIQDVPFTAMILATCLLVYLLSVFGLFGTVADVLLSQSVNVLTYTQEWWRLITPALIHFSVLHIIFNLLWWSMLGAQIERQLGTSMLVIIFLISAAISNGAQLLMSGPNFGGLSGVVYAVLGFVWWAGWLRPSWGIMLPKSIVGFMLVWLVVGYADVLWVEMANTAHTVGLITGCVLAWLLSMFWQPKISSDTDT